MIALNNEIIVKIKSLFPNLTKSEKRIAMFVDDHFSQISYMSINDLASQCEIGESTIMRFCKRLGYSGFYEFKQKVVIELQHNEEKNRKDDNKTISDIEMMFKETLQLSNEIQIQKAAQMIIESQNIYLFGVGFSGLSAQASQIRLTSLGYKAVATSEAYSQIVLANVIREGDLAIGISISGENTTTMECLNLARMNGAKIISITNHEKSSITLLSNVVLLTAGQELGKEGSTLITEMSQFIVLEQLFAKLHEMDLDRIKSMNDKIYYFINGENND